MARWRWLCILPAACLLLAGCEKRKANKPDPTKGTVTGVVFCADTGKPARFATVILSAAPKNDEKLEPGNPLPATESTVTGLDGRFTIEAVAPGRYLAFAVLDGYLDPSMGLDFTRLNALASDGQRHRDAIEQWKDHLTEVTVSVRRTSDLTLQVERAAEIDGTVTYDDGSPAIGMHFQLFRKTAKGDWTEAGTALLSGWSISQTSNSHGHFSLTNLSAGEYTVCALMPADEQDAAPRVCLGNTFRRKDAKTVKVQSGESVSGADIEIPLSGLHTVAGTISALSDGHPLGHGTVRLLYADDREVARQTSDLDEGSFTLEYVPEGKYILEVSGAEDAEPKAPEAAPGDSGAAASKTNAVHHYADKELPLNVLGDMDAIQIQLSAVPIEKPKEQ
jgi:hypothetical protein